MMKAFSSKQVKQTIKMQYQTSIFIIIDNYTQIKNFFKNHFHKGVYIIKFQNQINQFIDSFFWMRNSINTLQHDSLISIPIKCRNGPIEDRSCSIDCYCIFMYVGISGFLLAYASNAVDPLPSMKFITAMEQSDSPSVPFQIVEYLMPKICLCLGFGIAISLLLILIPLLCSAKITKFFFLLFLIVEGALGLSFTFSSYGFNIPIITNIVQNTGNKGLIFFIGILLGLAFLISLTMRFVSKVKLRYVEKIIMISREVITENWYLPIFTLLMCCLSFIFILISTKLFRKTTHPDNDSLMLGNHAMTLITIFWIFCTHGLLLSFSNFFLQSVTIFWYFAQTKHGDFYNRFLNLINTLRLLPWHISTIIYGSILAYIPDSLSSVLDYCESESQNNSICCLENNSFTSLTKFAYMQTIIQSLSFAESNYHFSRFKKYLLKSWGEVYFAGSSYVTLAKIFTIALTISLLFLLILFSTPHLLHSTPHLLYLFLIILLALLQVTEHIMGLLGIVGDTLILLFCFDLQLERQNYNETTPYSCPFCIRHTIMTIKEEDDD